MTRTKKKRGHLQRKLKTTFQRTSVKSKEHIKSNFLARLGSVRLVRLQVVEWILLVSLILLLAVVQLIWYHNSYESSAFVGGGTYSEATLGRINSMNPLYATTNSEKTLSRLLFSSLCDYDTSGRLSNDLAASVIPQDGGKSWVVKLKNGLKWSDGDPLDSSDIIYTFGVIQNPKSKTLYSSNFTGVKLTSTEDGGLRFELPAVSANFPEALVFPVLPSHLLSDVAPEALSGSSFSTSPIGSGPFVFNAIQGTTEQIVYLTSNPLHYAGAPLLNRFSLHTYDSIENLTKGLNSLAVTATAELLPTDADKITSSVIYEKQTTIMSGVFAFLNLDSPVLKNSDTRRALRQGIDMSVVRADLSEPALDYPILEGSDLNLSYPALPTHDPTKAIATIESLDLSPDTFLTIATTSTGHFPELARRLSNQLTAIGISSDVVIVSPNEILPAIIRPRAYDILIYEVELGTDPDPFPYYHSSQASELGLNLSNYRSSVSDDLLLAGHTALDPSVRTAKYQRFLGNWVNDVPAIGIYQVNLSYYFNRTARTFSESSRLVSSLDRFSDVLYWAVEKSDVNRTP